jgi:hypothetical protein
MPRPPVITDLREALLERRFPTVTVWNRLDGRPRTVEFDAALRAEVRDPLWMLARQWQMGEFRGEDAGSPVSATYHLSSTRPTGYRAQDNPPSDLPVDRPLEAAVEARTVPFTIGDSPVALDLRLAMGRRWVKLMAVAPTVPAPLPAAVKTAVVARWAVALPSDDVPSLAHPDVRATYQAVAGPMMDGYELYAHLRTGGHPYDGVAGVGTAARVQLDTLATRFVSWFERLIAQPPGPPAFDEARLEHRFSVTTPSAELTASEYPGGGLDWHAFSHGPSSGSGVPSSVTRTVIPGEVRFSGMPRPRWWSFEDGRTDFGAISADSTDLVKTLFLEFALIYSDDWFLLPCDLEEGTLSRVDGVVVTDVFGDRRWITPAGAGADDDWQRWSMFNLDAGPLGIFLPPGAPTMDGPPVEDVLLVRDEAANMVWGIEQTVWLATGTPMPGQEAARETLAYRRQASPPAEPLSPVAAIAYEAMSTVPENWIPFVPVHVPGDSREIQLQRGAMPRTIAGETTKVQPRTTLLRPGLDAGRRYNVHEEEVPRVGTRLSLAFHRTRWHDGSPIVWLGTHRATGRGEAGSGLDWDRIVNTP